MIYFISIFIYVMLTLESLEWLMKLQRNAEQYGLLKGGWTRVGRVYLIQIILIQSVPK